MQFSSGRCLVTQNHPRDEPPDVTTGVVVVVVGGTVVGGIVVVGATVVGVVVGVGAPELIAPDVPPDPAVAGVEEAVVVVVVVGATDVVVVPGATVVVVPGVCGGGVVDAAEPPGCSRATVTPMNAVAPVARTIVDRVSRRTRVSARSRWRAVGESLRVLTRSRHRSAHSGRATSKWGALVHRPRYAPNLKKG